MLRSLKDLEGYTISATDGEIGRVVNFLFDDEKWTFRYLVAEMGSLFDGRRALISPISFRRADWSTRRFHVALTTEKVENSPSIDVDKPVSRQHERDYDRYYGYLYYWGPGLWGTGALPGGLWGDSLSAAPPPEPSAPEPAHDVHLRSANDVRHHHVHGTDELVGHVEDFIVDDESWQIRYLVVDTSNWWFGKRVLLPPQWATRISWEEETVYVDVSRQAIKTSPAWDATTPITHDYEARLYEHFRRRAPWNGDHAAAPALH